MPICDSFVRCPFAIAVQYCDALVRCIGSKYTALIELEQPLGRDCQIFNDSEFGGYDKDLQPCPEESLNALAVFGENARKQVYPCAIPFCGGLFRDLV